MTLTEKIAQTILMLVEAEIREHGLITVINLEGETTGDWIAETNEAVLNQTVAGGFERATFLIRLNDERAYRVTVAQDLAV